MAKLDPSIFQTINPATGEVIESFRNFGRLEIERVLNRSVSSFTDFRRLTVFRRAELLLSLATALRRNREVLAATVTQEMGKIIAEAEAEVEKCAQQAEWYAEHGPQMLADRPVASGRTEAYISYRPLGAIFAVMPWNFPLWQVTRFCISTLLAGNTVLLKHSPNVQRCGLELERVMLEAGFPDVWTQDVALARRMALELEVGGVFINGVAASNPRVPIGGVKQSGYGRELGCVRQGMPVFDAETFGPVAALTSVIGAEGAVTLANSSPYGLSANGSPTRNACVARTN